MNVSNTMSKMTRLGMQHAGAILGSAAAWVSTAAYAVNDLPGGPAVNQLNLHPAVTKIAEEQQWLHWFMMAIC
ncbi:MAG: cytochrome c oxidase subunit II, partial [Polaromonas sp.]